MKEGWEIKTINQISENLDSKRIPVTKRIRNAGNVPYYGASGIVDYVEDFLFDEDLLLISEDGANLLARTYPIAYSISGKSWVNNHAHVLKFSNSITQKFVEIYLNSLKIDDFVSGMAQPKLNQTMLNKIQIPIPPFSEQKRIVLTLDEAFASIAIAKANAEQNLKNAKELFESYADKVFNNIESDWERVSLGVVCKINDGTHFSPKNSIHGDYMYITAKNIKPYYLDLSNVTYISAEDHKEIYTRCPVTKDDVLYIKDGATAGIATINTLEKEFSLLSSVALFKCSTRIHNSFLVHYMNSPTGRKNFLGYIDGAAITRLTLIKLKNVCIPLPPIKKQHTISGKLDALLAESKKLEKIYVQKINDLEELKKSILQKAFSGELN